MTDIKKLKIELKDLDDQYTDLQECLPAINTGMNHKIIVAMLDNRSQWRRITNMLETEKMDYLGRKANSI